MMDADSEMDGEDITMRDVYDAGKKFKVSDTFDGDFCPLTVPEVVVTNPTKYNKNI